MTHSQRPEPATPNLLSRRQVVAAAVLSFWHVSRVAASPTPPPATAPARGTLRYKVGVCDWMMLKRQRLGALQLTKDVGADGVEVDMGGLGDRPTFDNQLVDPAVRKQFLDASRDLGVEICSIAMSGFYAQSFPERETAVRAVLDCIDTMQLM